MKRTKLNLFAALAFATLSLSTSCMCEDFDQVPVLANQPEWPNATVTIKQARSLLRSGQTTVNIKDAATKTKLWDKLLEQGVPDSAIIIEGTVISSDSAGNFYKVVTIQDTTAGIDLKVADKNLYLVYGFKPGQKIRVRLNDLALSNYKGMYQIGIPQTDYNDNGTQLTVAGVPINNMSKVAQLLGNRGAEEPIKINMKTVTKNLVQRLVTVDSVQFIQSGITFVRNHEATNRTLIDQEWNRTLIVRTNAHAQFANDTLPSGMGSITGVLGIYNQTLQLFIRDPRDIRFDNGQTTRPVPQTNTTIAELKLKCKQNVQQIADNVVISGVVNATDRSGNIYKSLFLEDRSGAIEFKIDKTNLDDEFPVGTNLTINCQGLHLGKYGGVVQLGGLYQGKLGRLPENELWKHTFVTNQTLDVQIVKLNSLNELNDKHIGRIVTINNLQFIESDLGKPYAERDATTNRTLTDAHEKTIVVRTSNYASFANNPLPQGSGSITAVLGKFNKDYQLQIRDLSEVNLNNPRFEVTAPQPPIPNTTIAELRKKCPEKAQEITDSIAIEGVVISSDKSGNIYKKLYIDDGTGGLAISIDNKKLYESYPVGTKLIISCIGMYLGKQYGEATLGGLNGQYVGWCTDFGTRSFVIEKDLNVTPTVTTINKIDNSMLGRLIELDQVQFKTPGKTYADTQQKYTTHVITDMDNNTIDLKVNSYAKFKDKKTPEGKVNIIAILGTYNGTKELYIRDLEDVQINK